MATFFDDFSQLALGQGVPAGYSAAGGGASGYVEVVQDLGTPGEKSVRFRNVPGGDTGLWISCDEFSSSSEVREVALLVRVVNLNNHSRVAMPAVRLSPTVTTTYAPSLVSPNVDTDQRFQAARLLDSAFQNMASVSNQWHSNGDVVALRMRADGSTIYAKWWNPADVYDPEGDEPSGWMHSPSNSDIASGLVGFGGFQAADDYIMAFGVGTGGDPAPLSEVATAVPVPSGFTFTATGLQLDGAWSAVSGADSYDWEIQRDDAGSWVAFESGNTATLAFQVTTGVAYGTTYRARVRADDGGVKSDWTAYTSASTPADALAISATQIEAVALSWTAATGPYDVRRDETDLIAEGLTVTTFTDDDVEAGTSYTYEVREDGGAWSEPVTVAVVAGGGGVFFLKPNGGGWST